MFCFWAGIGKSCRVRNNEVSGEQKRNEHANYDPLIGYLIRNKVLRSVRGKDGPRANGSFFALDLTLCLHPFRTFAPAKFSNNRGLFVDSSSPRFAGSTGRKNSLINRSNYVDFRPYFQITERRATPRSFLVAQLSPSS